MSKERMDYVVGQIFVSCRYACEGLHFACQNEDSGYYEEDYDNRYAVENDMKAYDLVDENTSGIYWEEMVDDMVNELGITKKELEQGYEYINKLYRGDDE